MDMLINTCDGRADQGVRVRFYQLRADAAKGLGVASGFLALQIGVDKRESQSTDPRGREI
jgi:hypothetical protein